MTKPRLLLVDDDPLIAETLSFALARDFDVAQVGDRPSAVSALRGRPVEVRYAETSCSTADASSMRSTALEP